jgi:Chromosome segregation ATPases
MLPLLTICKQPFKMKLAKTCFLFDLTIYLPFLAIQFVLSDESTSLRHSDSRQALLHEGTGPRVVNAYVEIVFDNTDHRVPVSIKEAWISHIILHIKNK